MTPIDYLIILLYFVGLLALGGVLGRRIKSSKEMFIAGRNSSWWLSGLSTYMTIFSAGTFVVWGGVAYRSGVVAIVVGLMLGIASFLVGKFVAGKWASMRIDSPAEYLTIRFGKATTRFFIIVGMIGKGVHTAVALYAVAIMAVALMPLPEGHLLADPLTGHLSITYAILILGLITFVYTAAGGFLAVLMTDVVQFAILMGMILLMIPLSLSNVGGIQSFIENAPPHYFALFTSPYSWVWMVLWCLLHVFMIGGDWAFVQRYISVPTPRDAKKSAYLVGALYLITPLFFYVPALCYRLINPEVANPEQAYMLMSQHVLATGMLGMMMAAMLSATMSMVSGTLNVYANVFTYDIFKSMRPKASDKTLMTAGRTFTFAYGSLITLVAILIPLFGGAERVVVSVLTLVISPLFIPSIWGLYSRHIDQKAVFITMGITFATAILAKTGLLGGYVDQHATFVDAFIGLVFPVAILLVIELVHRLRPAAAGWDRLAAVYKKGDEELTESQKQKNREAGAMYSNMAFKILMGTYGAIGLIMLILAFVNPGDRGDMLRYGGIFLGVALLAFAIYYFFKFRKKRNTVSR